MKSPQARLAIALVVLFLGPALGAQESLTAPGLEVRHPAGMRGAAERVAEVYPRLKDEVERRIGFHYTRTLSVWLERDQEDFNARIVAVGGSPRPEHVAAVAFPLLDLVVIKAEAWRRGEPTAFAVTFQHEIVHCLLGELRRRRPEMRLPVWLDEGIAQWASEAVYLGTPDLVAQAARKDELIPFAKLRSDFPDQEGASALAYAQSHALVRFIARHDNPTGRKNNVQGLLLQLGDGADVEEALRAVVGLGFDELERAWKDEVRATLPFSLRDLPDLVFGVLILVLSLLAYSVYRVRRADRLAALEAEDAAEARLEDEAPPPRSRRDRIRDYWQDRRDPD